ncbi:(2Fe-2S)-binding protein [Sphingobium sp. CR2-8]|uniref:(2Fe-2S)-binding protein n=1 Tax=Sphingobium sp. CR2-8 TaxID=1306534 RepID=UPI002DBA145D|nr:(2Fe-2S)-binding protein [Sphingobium sp. CR2-8]MEC3911419.1 (2Fe-2S)-binding protein [Sphingobium sp. CR2-8]
MSISLTVNGVERQIDVPADTPLLWVIRDEVGLKGTKFGCGVGICGACTVHADGVAVRSCSVGVGDIGEARITTIEGLDAGQGDHAVQAAWIAEQVPQCGYCQPGMVMAVAAMLSTIPKPTDADIDDQITNICRCGTYPRIRRAIHRAAATLSSSSGDTR